jgi:hypothetical protein
LAAAPGRRIARLRGHRDPGNSVCPRLVILTRNLQRFQPLSLRFSTRSAIHCRDCSIPFPSPVMNINE